VVSESPNSPRRVRFVISLGANCGACAWWLVWWRQVI
jgi:hypothetical protein